MKKLFVVIQNMLVFFFVMNILSPAIQVNGIVGLTQVINSVFVGILYGLFIMLVPNLIKFLKMKVQTTSLYMMTILVSFIFFFLLRYSFNLIVLKGGNVTIIPGFVISLADQTVTIVFLSVIIALVSVSMLKLSEAK
jgi:hypothetical protein